MKTRGKEEEEDGQRRRVMGGLREEEEDIKRRAEHKGERRPAEWEQSGGGTRERGMSSSLGTGSTVDLKVLTEVFTRSFCRILLWHINEYNPPAPPGGRVDVLQARFVTFPTWKEVQGCDTSTCLSRSGRCR